MYLRTNNPLCLRNYLQKKAISKVTPGQSFVLQPWTLVKSPAQAAPPCAASRRITLVEV